MVSRTMGNRASGRLGVLALLLASGCLFGRSSQNEVHLRDDAPPPDVTGDFSLALYQSTGVELVGGNDVTWVDNGAVFDAIEKEIAHAKVSVNIVTFIWSDGQASDRVLGALAARQKEGIRCRLLIDSVGTLNPSDALKQKLRGSGCELRWARPVPGPDDAARNHRKLVIVDGRVAFTGGFGIDDKWLGHGQSEKEWRDSAVRVEGPVVRQVQQAFAENWQEAGGALLPAEELPKVHRAGHARAAFVASTEHGVITRADRLMQLLLSSARRRVWVQNAYFVPSEPVLGLLRRRATERLDVRVLTAGEKTDTKPYLPASRARMADLVDAGGHAWEYGPAMMHAKTVLVDDSLVAVGSTNLDALSLNKLDEGMLVVDDADVARQLESQWQQDLARSRPVAGSK